MGDFVKNVTEKIKKARKAGDASGTGSASSSRNASPSRDTRKSTATFSTTSASSAETHANGVHARSSVTEKIESPRTSTDKLRAGKQELLSKLHLRDGHPHADALPPKTRDGDEMSKNQIRKHEKQVEAEQKREKRDRHSVEHQHRREELYKKAVEEDTPEQQNRYGLLPVNAYAGEWHPKALLRFSDLTKDDIGKEVSFRARLHNIRNMSARLTFLVLRQTTATLQGVLQRSDLVSENMVRWAEHLPIESIVLVKGVVQEPQAKEGEVKSTIIHEMEVMVQEIKLVTRLTEHLPFTVPEAEITEEEANATGSHKHHVSQRTRLASRIIDLRTNTANAIFKVQSGVGNLFRQYLISQEFMEIHTPKLQGGATESGASVFKVDYFGRTAFLAQSPQLAKQMSVAADFRRVYEVGPVFRAENSNTHRHLTEYTGLDIEMAIDEHYHEALKMVDRTLKNIFKGVYERYRPELELIKRQFPHEDLVWLDETPVFKFKEAIQMLNDSGWTDEEGNPLPLDEDLGTRDEVQLGKLIKEKYKTDYYIIDKFPASARPFYTMPDPADPNYTNSFDIFLRGQEITTGGQRIHDATMLINSMKKAKVDPKSMEEYMQGFEWGAPPHAGAGIGLERLLMLFLKLGDIRHASMYPRDPRSLPAKPKITPLRHPEASTLHPPWEDQDKTSAHHDLQQLEMLIANYGDASNTSWLEEKFVIWRDAATGSAIGYVPHQGFAITVGNPLCHASQYRKIIAEYLDYIKRETHLKPLWLLCGSAVEEVLAEKLDWRTFTCAAEQRVNLTLIKNNDTINRKIRHAEREGIKVHDISIGTHVPHDVQEKVNKRIEDWLAGRKSHQHVHLTGVHPWQDMEHRQYHYANDRENKIQCLVVMAQLAPEYGWQVKYSLDFPGAESGAIEMTIMHAFSKLKAGGSTMATFGGGATSDFTPGHNLKGQKVKLLSRAYHSIATELKLTQKSEFREKLGAEEDPIYVCYPPKGLGPRGIRAILSFFED